MRLSLSLLALSAVAVSSLAQSPKQPELGHRSVSLLTVKGLQFKDLNHNGKLDAYEDWRLSSQKRAADLVQLMSVEDLAGLMVHGTLPASGGAEASIGRGSGYDEEKSRAMIDGKRINTFITRLGGDPVKLAESNNRLQAMAEATRFGIPITISTDPRNNFLYVAGASVEAGSFSKWPETTGFAAINDPALTKKFADTVRREYMAVGIREALSPQADLATEPRWARLNGTFGEDADVAGAQVKAYVEGMQDGATGLKSTSVLTVVKHWVGYGAQKDGWDSHNYYGRYATLKTDQLAYHVKPFLGAFQAHVASVMPTYSVLENVTLNGKKIDVGAGYSKPLLTDLLRGKYGFRGVVVSDWGITSDCGHACQEGVAAGEKPSPANIAMSWGVMDRSRPERFALAVNAGVDQVGGTEDVAALLDAQKSGKLTEVRMRESATAILQQKFAMGIFEDPYVDASKAKDVVGNSTSLKIAQDTQKRAMVPLENKLGAAPVKAGAKVWLFHVDATVAKKHGLTVVDSPEAADVAILRAETPWETLHPGYFFGGRQHEGRLNFQAGDAAYDALMKCGKTPAVMTVYLDRPAILTEVKDKAAALYADFGVSDDALLDVVMGQSKAEGRLPFELPRSMDAVKAQDSGAPHDSAKPLYAYGYRLP
jgi:beta-glucosidase